MKISLSRWIGTKEVEFERVGLAFQVYGYQSPTPDIPGGSGAHALNIVEQYAPHLSQAAVLSLIEYGLMHGKAYLQQEIAEPELRMHTLEQLAQMYQDEYERDRGYEEGRA